ncbi:MAG: hypothetical protein ABGX16_05405 [Pirellulales bacterium]
MRSLVSVVAVAVVSPVVGVRATVASLVAVVRLFASQVAVAPATAVTLAASHVAVCLPNCVLVALPVRLPAHAAASPVVVALAIAASQAVDVRLLASPVAVALAEHSPAKENGNHHSQ